MKNIIIVVDMQNGNMNTPETMEIKNKLSKLLSNRVFDKVIATRFILGDNSTYEKYLGYSDVITVQGRSLVCGIVEYANVVIDRFSYGCNVIDLIQKLRQLNNGEIPEKVFITGVDLDRSVMQIAVGLFEVGIRPVVLTKYSASTGGEEPAKAGISCLQRMIGTNQLVSIDINSKDDLGKL